MRNHSYENDFDLHENETACRTHFHKNGVALRLVLKQRYKRTRKWPIVKYNNQVNARFAIGQSTMVYCTAKLMIDQSERAH